MFQTQFMEKIKRQFLCSETFFENYNIYDLIWKNEIEPDTPQITIRCVHIAC